MRFFVSLFLAVLFVRLAAADLRPLSVKDVSLMLRAGYSSESVLREIEQRRLIDAPDAATIKSLGEFGASPQLLDAVESGQFRLDAAAAESARAIAEAAAKLQEQSAENAFRNATAILKEQQATATQQKAAGAPFLKSLNDKLVVCRDGEIGPADMSGAENKKLIAIYFSAHWCAPCRKFTPQLVDFYNRVESQHPEFEIVFFSFDHSRADWETYLRETRMPWLAIDYDQLGALSGLKQICGDGIPSLVLLDGTGHVLSTSYDNGKYVGPQKVVADIVKIFESNGEGAPTATR
ncbi:MAG TPA: thioredoxin-like domain-containing protein [Chthoniobacterales bacterium]